MAVMVVSSLACSQFGCLKPTRFRGNDVYSSKKHVRYLYESIFQHKNKTIQSDDTDTGIADQNITAGLHKWPAGNGVILSFENCKFHHDVCRRKHFLELTTRGVLVARSVGTVAAEPLPQVALPHPKTFHPASTKPWLWLCGCDNAL